MLKGKNKKKFCGTVAGLALFAFLSSCGHDRTQASGSAPPPAPSISGEFSLARDSQSDIVIPVIDGMQSTAFVVSASAPAGVIPYDLDTSQFLPSKKFAAMICPSGSGTPSRLAVRSESEAFLLTSNSIISFNPGNAAVYGITLVALPINIGPGHRNSDGTPSDPGITPGFPGGIAVIGDALFISSANYLRTQTPAKAAPGTVIVFRIGAGGSLTKAGHIVTSGFNPTGISVLSENEIVVTNSGLTEIEDAVALPRTDSSVDIINTDTLEISASISLGLVGASFHRPALTGDRSLAFIGSAVYGHIYEIDLINRQVLRGPSNPIIVNASSSDYISDVAMSFDGALLFASSLRQGSVIQIDLTGGFPVETNRYGVDAGAGPLAIRPGIEGTDFLGPGLFTVAGYPQKLVSIAISNAPHAAVDAPEDDVDTGPPPPTPEEENDPEDAPCQGFVQAVESVRYGSGAGFGQNKFPQIVMGAPKGMGKTAGSLDVLSLGIGGEIVLDMGPCQIEDGSGADFIVFENTFFIAGNETAPYAELASVAVSQNGVSFAEFPCSPDSIPYDGCAGWHPVYSSPEGKISPFEPSAAGGDAFDLATIEVKSARYVRIRDVRGAQGGTSSGFDLDAVAVVNGRKK